MKLYTPTFSSWLAAQLAAAAASEFDVIRADIDRVTHPQIRAMLRYIGGCLYSPELRIGTMKSVLNLRDNSIQMVFKLHVGMPPSSYIQRSRIRTACRLLTTTRLRIWQIADLTGYSSLSVFAKAFERSVGSRPALYRKKNHIPNRPPLPEGMIEVTDNFLDLVVAERAADDSVLALLIAIVQWYPPLAKRYGRKPKKKKRDRED